MREAAARRLLIEDGANWDLIEALLALPDRDRFARLLQPPTT